MSDARGFLKFPRQTPGYRPVQTRLADQRDVLDHDLFGAAATQEQAARCMDCGVPFCQSGCPLGNYIPEFNDAVHRGKWQTAFDLLRQTNNFPEFTGRICPAPCEHACVLGINRDPVAIEHLEREIIERAFSEGWVLPHPPARRNGRKVAVIGSGPAGLAAADELNRKGFSVTVFEKDERPGGLLRFGIPDFKLEKWVVERRISLLEAEGVVFCCGVEAGNDIFAEKILTDYDFIVLCMGALQPRDLPLPGRELAGVHFALTYLTDRNRAVSGLGQGAFPPVSAAGKHVVVIGGGDTGADCVGAANREGALSVTQIQYRPMPGTDRPEETPWPLVPATLSTSSSHEEGCERAWEIRTNAFVGDAQAGIRSLSVSNLQWEKDPSDGRYRFSEIESTRREIPCDLALIAIGFRGVAGTAFLEQLGLNLDEAGRVPATRYRTENPKVFVAGDARRGQSLVVWAIAEGRAVAAEVMAACAEPY